MTYPSGDPRSQLVPVSGTGSGEQSVRAEPLTLQCFDFGALEPDHVGEGGSPSWIVRSANAVVVLTELAAGATVERVDADEATLVVPSGSGQVRVGAGGEQREVRGEAIAMIPPGPSTVTATVSTRILRLFSTTATDLVEASRNAGVYAAGSGAAASTSPWPEPVGGPRLRVYGAVADIAPAENRLGRIFRSRHVMVNFLYPRVGPRDPASMSPHSHDDFEQLSYVDEGDYVHHVRREWGNDRRRWRPDEHVSVGGPSLTIIPPPLVHTSEAVGAGTNRMIDIFAGPRADFSARPGWVLNAADYSAPAEPA